ncbi:MAG: hypothetical protein AAB851_01420 [Patescibacteria group bacterium]
MQISKLQSKIKKEQGVTLLIVVSILGSMTTIAFGVALILLTEIRLSEDISKTVSAFYAADSGAERILYSDRKEGGVAEGTYTGALDNGASYSTIVEKPANTIIRSVGTDAQGKTRRGLELSY